MILFRRLILIPIFIFFGCTIYAQNGKKLMPLKNILVSIENQHGVSFNYLDSDIETISISAPSNA